MIKFDSKRGILILIRQFLEDKPKFVIIQTQGDFVILASIPKF